MNNSSKKTILLVECEADVALAEKAVLEKCGYRVKTVDSGEKAVEIVKSDREIDLVLMAVHLGSGMDGTDAAKIILSQRKLPLVFISSHTEQEIVEKTEGITSYGYIVKASGEAVFAASIRMAFRLFESITGEEEKENALRESEERFSIVLQNLPGIVFVHDMDGRFLFVNQAACINTGYSEDELLSMHVSDIDPSSVTRNDRELLWHALKTGESTTLKSTHIRKDGSGYPVEIHLSNIILDARPVILSITQDITERIRSEEEIKRQLTEKEILLKEVHHRIKNQMTAVSGLLSLQAEFASSPEARSALEDSMGRMNSMRVLYEKLLLTDDYTDISTGEYLDSLVDTIVDAQSSNGNITVEKQIENYRINARQLFSVGIITNELVTNAVKYAGAGSRPGLIRVNFTREKDLVTLSVHDNGKGFPQDFNINDSEGFGLQLVKMLARQLRGDFSIANRDGAVCTLNFPMPD